MRAFGPVLSKQISHPKSTFSVSHQQHLLVSCMSCFCDFIWKQSRSPAAYYKDNVSGWKEIPAYWMVCMGQFGSIASCVSRLYADLYLFYI